MERTYSFARVESCAQRHWRTHQVFRAVDASEKEKFYCLSMMPYPSGRLHIGHVRNYTAGDVIARYQRMLGKNVLHPMGWDAFGLPAENAAIQHRMSPKRWTHSNIAYMKRQLQRLGFSYDWTRELVTCRPQYYRWEQWLFVELHKRGLLYRKRSWVNWCPKDQTVLANEQVVDGGCWRCSSPVRRRYVSQWFVRITRYAEQLLQDAEQLHGWPQTVKSMQKHWIGKSHGIAFVLWTTDRRHRIQAYAASPALLTQAACVVVSVHHPLVLQRARRNETVRRFVARVRRRTDGDGRNPSGVDTGLTVRHPLCACPLSIWTAEFDSLPDFEARVVVPTGNLRDRAFAEEHGIAVHSHRRSDQSVPCSAPFDFVRFRRESPSVRRRMVETHLVRCAEGKEAVRYRLQDWVVSRQRYWGVPIPMVASDRRAPISVNQRHLPVLLPRCERVRSVRLTVPSVWKKTTHAGQPCHRDTDTLDTFVESSWYYARYTCPHHTKRILDASSADYWLPVDQYIGGIEHATMHLMYVRFFHKVLRDLGLVSSDEPVKKLLCQGMVLADAFYYVDRRGAKHWVSPSDARIRRDARGNILEAHDPQGRRLVHAGLKKMTKSRNNGIDPAALVERYGSDAVRLFVLFSAPIDMPLAWTPSGIDGCYRFLQRVWKLVYEYTRVRSFARPSRRTRSSYRSLRAVLHRTIVQVTRDVDERQSFHTAVSALMKLTNEIVAFLRCNRERCPRLHSVLSPWLRMLYPFAPHICFALWRSLTGQFIDCSVWPTAPTTSSDVVDLSVHCDNRFRLRLTVPRQCGKASIVRLVLEHPTMRRCLHRRTVRRVVYVSEKKIVNVLTERAR